MENNDGNTPSLECWRLGDFYLFECTGKERDRRGCVGKILVPHVHIATLGQDAMDTFAVCAGRAEAVIVAIGLLLYSETDGLDLVRIVGDDRGTALWAVEELPAWL